MSGRTHEATSLRRPPGAGAPPVRAGRVAPELPEVARLPADGDRAAIERLRLSPSQIVRLQRMAGNRAVARLLAAEGSTDGGAPVDGAGALLQRNGTSADLLKKLATPQIFKAPDVILQEGIVDALETVAIKHGAAPAGQSEGGKYIPEILLGGIVLDAIPRDGREEESLIKDARLLELKKGEHSLGYGASTTEEWFRWVQEAGVEQAVVENTLRTVIKAEQMEYLRRSGFVGKGYRVVLEVHYVRSRPKNMTGFHKDTLGQTLFVNLSFNVGAEFPGPEYVMNPPLVREHEEQIERSLPKEFMDDLKEVRKGPKGDIIEAPKVPGHSVVAFVDEAIHHATPHYGHRGLKAEDFATWIRNEYGQDLVAKYETAHEKYNAQWGVRVFPYRSYLASDLQATSNEWYQRIELMKGAGKTYTRPDFVKAGLTTEQIDRLLEEQGHYREFRQVGIPDPGHPGHPFRGPLHEADQPPLKRRMSMHAQRGALPPPIAGARSFFRTWVRVQPVD